MIRCTPKGVCSWNYLLEGSGCSARTELNAMGESGRLWVGPTFHDVAKQGFMSGTWMLVGNGGCLASARKLNPFTRSIVIERAGGSFLLEARSAMGRTMLFSGPGISCEITPEHAFTRRANITGQWDDFTTVAFAFWLVSLMWRRAANNSSGAG
jgi:hypothetical protein